MGVLNPKSDKLNYRGCPWMRRIGRTPWTIAMGLIWSDRRRSCAGLLDYRFETSLRERGAFLGGGIAAPSGPHGRLKAWTMSPASRGPQDSRGTDRPCETTESAPPFGLMNPRRLAEYGRGFGEGCQSRDPKGPLKAPMLQVGKIPEKADLAKERPLMSRASRACGL